MEGRIDKRELVDLVAQRVNRDADTVGEIVDATLAEIYQALKRGDQVTLRDFGSLPAKSPGRANWRLNWP